MGVTSATLGARGRVKATIVPAEEAGVFGGNAETNESV